LAFTAWIVLSSRSEAASIYERFEYHSFWSDVFPIIIMVALAIGVGTYGRRLIRQQVASAPRDARRNKRERLFHRLSLLFIAAPLVYGFVVDDDLLFPLVLMLAAMSLLMVASRPLKSRFGLRLLCIPPAGLIAFAVGKLASTWPFLGRSLTVPGNWALALCSASFAIGVLLAFLSFPVAYRARAW
jgi:hypothetical protein